MAVRMVDIAREAGVTRQAVSAVLNHPKTCRISQPMQEKIRDIAKRLGYVPNISAKILIVNKQFRSFCSPIRLFFSFAGLFGRNAAKIML